MMPDLPFLLSVDGESIRVTMALEGSDIGDDEAPRVWLTVLTAGQGEGKPLSGEANMKIDKPWLERLAASRTKRIAVDIHHAKFQAAKNKDPRFLVPELSGSRAEITDWRIVGNALQGFWEFTKAGAALVRDGLFRFPSLEFTKDKIVGCTLTPDPYWDVPAFVLSDGKIEPIGSHAGGSMVEPENTRAEPPNVAIKEEPMSDEIKALADRLGCEVEKVDETITALSKRLDDTTAENAELRKTVAGIQADRAVETLLRDGKITADEEDAARELHALSADMFGKVYGAREAGSRVPVGEVGQDAEDTASAVALTQEQAGDKLDAIARDIGDDYAAAFAKAIEDNPDLYAIYAGEEV